MKSLKLILAILILTGLSACQKKKYPESVTENEPVFRFSATIEQEPVAIAAGVNDYYVFSGFMQDTSGLYTFSSDLKQIDCQQCSNRLEVSLNNYTVSSLNAPVDADMAFAALPRNYLKKGLTYFDASFAAQFNQTAAGYLWDFGDGSVSTQQNPVHRYNSPGNYNVCLTITSTAGCVSQICNTYNISLSGCRTNVKSVKKTGTGVSFDHVTDGTQPYSFLWSFGDGSFSTEENPYHVFPVKGSYPVILTLTDSKGNKAVSKYNATTNGDVSSCAANFSLQSLYAANESLLSGIKINWTDASGRRYSSFDVTQPASSYFRIISSENYINNDKGERTRKLHVKFSCLLTDGQKNISIENAETDLCMSYQ
jgi:PKD repeat protein